MEQNKNETLIDIKDLSVHFKRNGRQFQALNKVSLKIKKGDIVGIVGESGSGKTTLGRAILGLWEHSTGHVEISGKKVYQNKIKTVNKNTEWIFKEGQMIFQDPNTSLNQKAKILEIISEGYLNFKYFESEYLNKVKEIKNKIISLKIDLHHLANPKELEIKKAEEEYEGEKINLIKNYISNNEVLQKEEWLKKLILKNKDAIRIWNEKINEVEIAATKNIKLLKNESYTKKLEFQTITKHENEYMKKSRKEEIQQFNLLKSKTVPPKYYMKEIIPEIYKKVFNIYEEINETLKQNLPTQILEISKKEVYQAIQNYDFFVTNIKTIKELLIKKTSLIKEPKLLIKVEYFVKQIEKAIEWKRIWNTSVFKYISNYVIRTVNQNIKSLKIEINDLMKLIIKKSNTSSKLVIEKERIIQEEEIISLKYIQILLGEKIEYYTKFLSDFENLILEHDENNYKNIYHFLIRKNKEIEKIHMSISAFTFRKKIWRENQLKKIRIEAFKKGINDFIKYQDEITLYLQEEKFKIEKEKMLLTLNEEFNNLGEKLKEKIKLIEKTDFEISTEKINVIKHIIENEEKQLIDLKKTYSSKNKKQFVINKVAEILSLVGLPKDAMNKFPSAFSGGQKQRIGIARAIINNPKFLIADEPISALDVSVQAQVVNLLKNLNKQLGLTILFIAHDLEMVNYISNKIYVIYKGNIVEYGDTDKIYKNPIHPYTKALMSSIPKLSNHGKKLDISNYNFKIHEYNDYKNITHHQIEINHYVFGTEFEIKKWTQKQEKDN